jgi:hypothetical protein
VCVCVRQCVQHKNSAVCSAVVKIDLVDNLYSTKRSGEANREAFYKHRR